MSATYWQKQAIEARGKVMVSASAGAGKTTVMIERLADILENGASLDNVLAVTFTKKAAAQMKAKLRMALINRLSTLTDEDKRDNIRRQLSMIATADISTIHSFCARLARTYFYALGVDSSFEIMADDVSSHDVKAQAMDELFEELYESGDEDFLYLLSCFRKKRSDEGLRGIIRRSYDEVRMHPHYREKLLASKELYTDEGFSSVCAEYQSIVSERCFAMVSAVENFAAVFKISTEGAKYRAILSEMRDALLEVAYRTDIFTPPPPICPTRKPAVKPENALADAEFVSFRDGIKSKYNALVKEIGDGVTERENFFESGRLARAFVDVLLKYDDKYTEAKREEGKADYADLEHFALRLVDGETGDKDVCRQINEKYKYVFVDEYQDVNPIQDEIIGCVGREDVFAVGDVKQAIYGFRGSQSRFFTEKSGRIEEEGGKYIILPDNFRSSRAVIDFVNRVFINVMRKPLCTFAYADGHKMTGGMRYPVDYAGSAEFCVFDKSADEKREETDVYSVKADGYKKERVSPEGLAVLQLVKEELSKTYYDPDLPPEQNPVRVQPGDICILTRKRANKSVEDITHALTEAGYQVAGSADDDAYENPAVRQMIDVLSYIDNSRQDIPLSSALLSPLGGMNENELATIRLSDKGRKHRFFRDCAEIYAKEKNDKIADKLNSFFEKIALYKKLSGSIGAARLIDRIIADGGFAPEYAAGKGEKLAAVRRLQREAYTPSGELYLGAFLSEIKKGGNNLPFSETPPSDCIKVMTMHASKGLEFPVVIIADISASFKGDDRAEMPFDEKFGFAPRRYDFENRTYSPTILRKLCKARSDREDIRNEINLFYVACTRAKYSLHVLASELQPFDPVGAFAADNYAKLCDVLSFEPRVLVTQTEQKTDGGTSLRVIDVTRRDVNAYEAVKKAFDYKYGYADCSDLPVKTSASDILKLRYEEEELTPDMFGEERESGALRPNAERGTAYHRFLQLCPFTPADISKVQALAEQFVREGKMDEGQVRLLSFEELSEILSMPIFRKLADKRLLREQEFLCRISSSDYRALKSGKAEDVQVGGDDGNGVVVQGAIDLLALGDGEAAIVDYKYSSRPDGYLVEKYAPQLALYKKVVSRVCRIPEDKISTTLINIFSRREVKL